MSMNAITAKELAQMGTNLEIRDGLNAITIKEIVKISVSQGRNIKVSSKCINAITAKEIATIGGEYLTIVIED